ncbi:hypothetical protein R1sor_017927 [Riccia sorocarpa]|uniref:Methyltransferase-like protein 13 n=1 Tax=Riccia sorocarpa TaxID=122646 RepID=A0ABD3IBY4_9MARC
MSKSHRTGSRELRRPGADTEGKVTNEFEEIKPGRRISVEIPFSSSISVTAVVLDTTRVAGGETADFQCAGLIVPRHREKEWVYSAEGGQWQLLACAGVSRLIILFPRQDPPKEVEQYHSRLVISDENVENFLRPLILALTPKILFRAGIPSIPFLNYSDNVIRRVEKEVAYSPLTGFMMVEDVELKPELEHENRSSCVSRITSHAGGEHELSEPTASSSKSSSTWRRRLIFKRLPNLIQTEVALTRYPEDPRPSGRERMNGSSSKRKHKSFSQTRVGVECVVDHSKLVHKYLPPIVAGFVLISPVLDLFIRSQHKAKIFCVGVGGGALPTFLHNHFHFHIKVIDLDEAVLDLAARHFGLKEDPNLEVIGGDGLDAVVEIAASAISLGLVHQEKLLTVWRSSSGDHKVPPSITEAENLGRTIGAVKGNLSLGEKYSCASRAGAGKSVSDELMESEPGDEFKATDGNAQEAAQCSGVGTGFQSRQQEGGLMDPRFEMIIVDVDASDARLELSAPPVAFLGQKFLLSAVIALKEHGMLVINVISSRKETYEEVIAALGAIFEEVYEIMLDNQIYHSVVFALVKPSAYNASVASPTVELIRSMIDTELMERIRRLECKNAKIF